MDAPRHPSLQVRNLSCKEARNKTRSTRLSQKGKTSLLTKAKMSADHTVCTPIKIKYVRPSSSMQLHTT